MTIFICISLCVREIFHFKQLVLIFPLLMFAFTDGAVEVFSLHANDTIITQLLTLTRPPSPNRHSF